MSIPSMSLELFLGLSVAIPSISLESPGLSVIVPSLSEDFQSI